MLVMTTNDTKGAINAAHSVLNEILSTSLSLSLSYEEYKAIDEAQSLLEGLLQKEAS